MRTFILSALAFVMLQPAADAQVAVQPLQPDSLYVSGEAASSASFAGGGGGVDWVHAVSARSSVTAGAASMRLGGESWTYGTLGGFTRRHNVWFLGSVGLGAGRRGPDSFPYVRVAGTVNVPLARSFSAETEGQYAQLNGTTVRVIRAGGVYGGVRKTSLRAAYVGASSPLQYWQYLFTRADVVVGRVGLLGGLTAGRGPTRLGTLGPELLLHTSQEMFIGASVHVAKVQATCIGQTVQQAGTRLARMMVTFQVPLGPRSVVRTETSR